jgi:hypothetical protein
LFGCALDLTIVFTKVRMWRVSEALDRHGNLRRRETVARGNEPVGLRGTALIWIGPDLDLI